MIVRVTGLSFRLETSVGGRVARQRDCAYRNVMLKLESLVCRVTRQRYCAYNNAILKLWGQVASAYTPWHCTEAHLQLSGISLYMTGRGTRNKAKQSRREVQEWPKQFL